MFYVVNKHLNNLYVLSNKAVGPGKNSKLINVGPTSIPEARVSASSMRAEFGGYLFFVQYSTHNLRPILGQLASAIVIFRLFT